MKDEIIAQLASVAAIIIVLALSYFYKTRFKDNMRKDGQGIIGLVVLIICIAAAVYMIS